MTGCNRMWLYNMPPAFEIFLAVLKIGNSHLNGYTYPENITAAKNMPMSKYLRSSTNPEPVRVIVQQLRVSV
jgi:hypothetical protein